ncbi:hypothetical protein ES702_03602 [subsurface metagenome]
MIQQFTHFIWAFLKTLHEPTGLTMVVNQVMTSPFAANTTPNEMSTQYKKNCCGTVEIWQPIIHNLSSSLVTGIKDFVTLHSSTSAIHRQSGPITGSDRASRGGNLSKTGYNYDSIQEMIDSIVANGMAWSQQSGSSQGWTSHNMTSKILPSQFVDKITIQGAPQAEFAIDCMTAPSS